MEILKLTRRKRIENLPNGTLFMSESGTIALKSEYHTDKGACECYIVGTGEFFWGGVKEASDLNKMLVYPIEIIE